MDINGDGRRDLVWVRGAADNVSYELAWALREGSGFGTVRSLAIDTRVDGGLINSAPSLAVGDLNSDGRPDVLLLLLRDGISRLALFRQTASGGFDAPTVQTLYDSAATAEIADVDGDGRNDAVVTHSATRMLGVLLQGPTARYRPSGCSKPAMPITTGMDPW